LSPDSLLCKPNAGKKGAGQQPRLCNDPGKLCSSLVRVAWRTSAMGHKGTFGVNVLEYGFYATRQPERMCLRIFRSMRA
jgi:hypothetical protein